MMLIDHAIQTEFIGQNVLIKIRVIEIGTLLRVENRAREIYPHGGKLIVRREIGPGELGKVIKFHIFLSLTQKIL
jgi:hypothetical protein